MFYGALFYSFSLRNPSRLMRVNRLPFLLCWYVGPSQDSHFFHIPFYYIQCYSDTGIQLTHLAINKLSCCTCLGGYIANESNKRVRFILIGLDFRVRMFIYP